MIKAVIIDDEINAQSLLEKTLDRCFPNKFNIVEKCSSHLIREVSITTSAVAQESFNNPSICLTFPGFSNF